MLSEFINDEGGIAADAFKLAAAIIVAAAVFVVLLGMIKLFADARNPIGMIGNASVSETQSNAEKIGQDR